MEINRETMRALVQRIDADAMAGKRAVGRDLAPRDIKRALDYLNANETEFNPFAWQVARSRLQALLNP